MTEEFSGRTALVTGGSTGIGRATAQAFAARGANVMIGDVDTDNAQETVRLITDKGGQAQVVRTDVSDDGAVAALVEATVEQYGSLDYAFNNAGIEGDLTPTHEYALETWDRVMAINLTGVFLCLRHEIPQMLRQGHGAIVNTASILGLVGFATTPAYTAAKHGVVGLTKVAALDYAEQGIRVNALCPGWIETPMVMERGVKAGEDRDMYDQLVQSHPVGRLGQPGEMAEVAVWLCSDAASFVTGQALAADGGYVAR